jgi:hypothetical protein
LRLAARSLRELFPQLPKQPGFHKRRARLTETTVMKGRPAAVRSSPRHTLGAC